MDLERVSGVEPPSIPWEGIIIAVIRHPRTLFGYKRSEKIRNFLPKTLGLLLFLASRRLIRPQNHNRFFSRLFISLLPGLGFLIIRALRLINIGAQFLVFILQNLRFTPHAYIRGDPFDHNRVLSKELEVKS